MILQKIYYFISQLIKGISLKVIIAIVFTSFITVSSGVYFIEYVFNPEVSKGIKKKRSRAKKFSEQSTMTSGDVRAIVKRNIFNLEGKVPDEDALDETSSDASKISEDIKKTTLPLSLVGIIYGGDPTSGLAVINNSKVKSINSFLVGDFISEGATLIEVQREKIIIDRGDFKEFLELEKPVIKRSNRGKVKKSSSSLAGRGFALAKPTNSYKEEGFEREGNEIVISKDFRNKMLSQDLSKILQDAKAEPFFESGELNGFKLTRIKQDSIYQKSGLQNNDVIREINGVSLIDTGQAIKLLQSLRGENEIEVRLTRGGSSLTLTMQVQ